MALSKKSTAVPAIDTHKDIVYPKDFSFKAVSSFSDILREKPRSRDKKAVLDLDEEEIMSSDDSNIELVKSHATALRLNNNMLADWDGFIETLQAMFIDPVVHLQWLDLSFNDLKTIDKTLLQLPNLTMLYLHGNNIKKANEVDKLASLHRLKSLTLHGNPIETVPGYRQYVVSQLPQLQTLDFSGVTRADRKTSEVWAKMVVPKKIHTTKKHQQS